jgi:hypothetical protein
LLLHTVLYAIELLFCFNPAGKKREKDEKSLGLTGFFETGPYYTGLSRLKSALLNCVT